MIVSEDDGRGVDTEYLLDDFLRLDGRAIIDAAKHRVETNDPMTIVEKQAAD